MGVELPEAVRELLHDCDPGRVSWERHRDFLIDRVLSQGSWEAILWLRRQAGDDVLRAHLIESRGRRLSPRQLRFWQVLLDLPEDAVTEWLADVSRQVWDRRSA